MAPDDVGDKHNPAPSQATSKSALTRERIINAAAQVLAERGYAGTKLSDIAERAELKAGSLYYHFADRDDLVDSVLRRGVDESYRRVKEALKALDNDATHVQRLETAIDAHLHSILQFGDVTSASLQLLRQLPPELQPRYRREQQRYGAVWHKLIVSAQRDGEIRDDLDPVRLRMFILGQLNWVADWPSSAVGDQDELRKEAIALVLHGVVPRS